MQLLLHRHELLGFRLGELEHRNARALRDHLGDHILIDDHTDVGFALTPGLLFLFALSLKLLLLVAKLGGLLELLVLDRLVLLLGDARNAVVKLLELRRRGKALDAQTRSRPVPPPHRSTRVPSREGCGPECTVPKVLRQTAVHHR